MILLSSIIYIYNNRSHKYHLDDGCVYSYVEKEYRIQDMSLIDKEVRADDGERQCERP